MKILLVHNYFHIVGGAETYFFNLAKLLKQKGHEVFFFSMNSPKNFKTEQDKYFVSDFPNLQKLTISEKIKSLDRAFYSFEARKKIRQLIREKKPDIVHINNIWYEITHSILHEIKKFDIPIIMTLHDYRMICPNHKLLINNKLCFDCNGNRYYKAILKKCMGNSLIKSIFVALSSYLNNVIFKTYKLIDLYISPSIFLIKTFKEGNLFKDINIVHLPYCIDIAEYIPYFEAEENTVVYAGRLDFEKGIDLLIDAVKGAVVTLKIIGTGPMEDFLRKKVKDENISNIKFLGFLSQEMVRKEVSKSLFSILPSIWNENYPYSIIESFALGKPVIGSKIGGIPELIKDNETGLLFNPGDANDLRQEINTLLSNKELINKMGKNARLWLEENLNYDSHYNILIDQYNKVIRRK